MRLPKTDGRTWTAVKVCFIHFLHLDDDHDDLSLSLSIFPSLMIFMIMASSAIFTEWLHCSSIGIRDRSHLTCEVVYFETSLTRFPTRIGCHFRLSLSALFRLRGRPNNDTYRKEGRKERGRNFSSHENHDSPPRAAGYHGGSRG